MKSPLRFEDDLLLTTVEVAHQGRKLTLSRVLIDTGSGGTAFATDVMETIGVTPESDDVVRRIRGVGGYETVVFKQIESLFIGAIAARDVNIEITTMGYGFGLEGIIGLDFLMRVGAIIDMAKLEIRTARKAAQILIGGEFMVTLEPQSFPYEASVRELVDEHLELKDAPLLLAVYYMPEDDTENIYLLEILDGFGGNEVSHDGELFDFSFGSSSGFPMREGQRLYLTLTNPLEWETAVGKGWPSAQRICNAIKQGHSTVIYQEGDKGKNLANSLC